MIDFDMLRHYLPVILLALAQLLQIIVVFNLTAQLRELRRLRA